MNILNIECEPCDIDSISLLRHQFNNALQQDTFCAHIMIRTFQVTMP